VAALNARLDELSARTAEIKAERAGREAADDYHVQAGRQAEAEAAATAEPGAAPADDLDAGMEMEPG